MNAQTNISTVDLNNFWRAYALLQSAKTFEDSVLIFQQEYFEKATKYNKKFIKIREFTPEEIVGVIKRYPRYFSSIQQNSNKIDEYVDEINQYLLQLENILPGFEQPDICFAFGCLRTGGTVSKNVILIGTEMFIGDSASCYDELSPWLKGIVSQQGDFVPTVIHEAVHTYQVNMYTRDLVSTVMKEGFAEFVTRNLLMLDNNPSIHSYGDSHECSLWKSFVSDTEKDTGDFSDWVYGGSMDGERPADLGYYIGLKVIEQYYFTCTDKKAALKYLADCKHYEEIFRSMQYNGGCE